MTSTKINTPNGPNNRYLYRFDRWQKHIDLEGQKLSARYWGMTYSFPHCQIENAEKGLAPGEGVFAIFFWYTLDIAVKQAVSLMDKSEPVVLQRVRSDDAYLCSYQHDEDEYLPDQACIYWNTEPFEEKHSHSKNGVSIRDLEVYDLDGVWRSYYDSELMAPAHIRLAKAGFRPFYYGTCCWDVYYASCRARKSDGRNGLIILLYSPPESPSNILNNAEAISSFLTSFMDDQQISFSEVELYIFADDMDHDPRPCILKYEVKKALIIRDVKEHRSGLLRRKEILVEPRRLKVVLDDLIFVSTEIYEDWLTDLFRLPSGKVMNRRSKQSLNELNQSIGSTSEPV